MILIYQLDLDRDMIECVEPRSEELKMRVRRNKEQVEEEDEESFGWFETIF